MSNQVGKRRKRLKRILRWLKAQKEGVTKYELKEFIFDNYALSESTIESYISDLYNFQYIIYKKDKIFIGGKRQSLLW